MSKAKRLPMPCCFWSWLHMSWASFIQHHICWRLGKFPNEPKVAQKVVMAAKWLPVFVWNLEIWNLLCIFVYEVYVVRCRMLSYVILEWNSKDVFHAYCWCYQGTVRFSIMFTVFQDLYHSKLFMHHRSIVPSIFPFCHSWCWLWLHDEKPSCSDNFAYRGCVWLPYVFVSHIS